MSPWGCWFNVGAPLYTLAWSWTGPRKYRQEETEMLGNVFLGDFPCPEEGARREEAGWEWANERYRLPFLPWTDPGSPHHAPLSPGWLWGCRSALPFKWTLLPWKLIAVLPKRLLFERVRRRFWPHPHHCQTDWHHMACQPGGPRIPPCGLDPVVASPREHLACV